jgi:hypothetical protein
VMMRRATGVRRRAGLRLTELFLHGNSELSQSCSGHQIYQKLSKYFHSASLAR